MAFINPNRTEQKRGAKNMSSWKLVRCCECEMRAGCGEHNF